MSTPEPLLANAAAMLERPFGEAGAAEVAERFDGAVADLVRRREVSVVVPIYNAGAALERCVESLLATRTRAEIVLVDDRSTDPAVERACRRLVSEHPTAKVVRHERNAGFVASVNTGIRASAADRDVVLLNSDTRVTPGWLDKLAFAAHSRPRVASVSPLSNAAGIFSLPHEHRENELPAGWSEDLCAAVLEEASWRDYEEMPATSGFCLYLRRDALEEVGLFDELLFLRGYAEENDFCARASAHGFVHLLDDATFVYHERAASFGSTKSVPKRRNARILKALHPEHHEAQVAWESRSRLGATRERYHALLRGLLEQSPAEARSALESATATTLVVGREDTTGVEADWSEHGRTAVVRLGDRESTIDLFGLGSASLGRVGAAPLGPLAWIANRLGARRLHVVDGALPEAEAARLLAALPLVGLRERIEAAR